MPFITQGKANIKYILIVVILAAIVGGGILVYQYWWLPKKGPCPEGEMCTADVVCFKNPSSGEKKFVPSICSCGLDAGQLAKEGWIECPEEEADQKREVEQVALYNLGNYLTGDAENYSRAFSENYIDWGSGPVNMNKAFLEERFSEERFDQLKVKLPEEVVDLDKKIILGYSEILKSEVYESYEGKYGFHFQEGDVFIYFPSKQESLMPDGFSGVYRRENEIWKIVISD